MLRTEKVAQIADLKSRFDRMSSAVFLDFTGMTVEEVSKLRDTFRGKGIEDVTVYRGSRGDRALLEITTNSEAAIFRSLEAAAAVLLQMQNRGIKAFELSMMSSARERAGEFTLTPELANVLAQKQIETSAFYVQNVVF